MRISKRCLPYEEMLAIGGDYNIAPEDADVHDPKLWEGSVLTHDEVRKRFRRILQSRECMMHTACCHPMENEY